MTALGDGRSGVPIPCWRSTRSAERPFGLPVDVATCCSVFKPQSWAPGCSEVVVLVVRGTPIVGPVPCDGRRSGSSPLCILALRASSLVYSRERMSNILDQTNASSERRGA